MGNSLNKEFQNVQNPALGAYIIWNFTSGFYSYKKEFTPLPLLFIVLPIIYKRDIADSITGTQKRSGLRNLVEKFNMRNDIILQIHKSSERMKNLSLDAIKIALVVNLISIDEESSLIMPISTSKHKGEPKEIQDLGSVSEKLGYWCAQLTMHEISQILKVRF